MADLKESIAAAAPELRFRFGEATWELKRIPAGQFSMGTPLNEPGRLDGEMPPKPVKISKPFYLGKYEITQAQFRSIMHSNPSGFKGDKLAIDQVKYSGALEYCRRLSQVAGVTVTLPTEAQWEYACRAGTTSPYYSGSTEADLDKIAWYRANSGGTVHPVGEKEPNEFGLYDMVGNVYEPCIDYVLSFQKFGRVDPEGSRSPAQAAARGGAWMESADRCRVGFRIQTDDMFGGMGIRIAINP